MKLPGFDQVDPGRPTGAAELPSHVKPGRWWAREQPLAVWHIVGKRWSIGSRRDGEQMWRWHPLCQGESRVEYVRQWIEVGRVPVRPCKRCLAAAEREMARHE